MNDWSDICDCCNKSIKRIKNDDFTYSTQNLDGTDHEKHFKIWVTSIASFSHYDRVFEKLDPERKLGDMTVSELEYILEYKLNLKFGQYFHGQSGYKEIWLTPKKFTYGDIDYFVSGSVDGIENGTLIELKTTWATSKTKVEGVIERAKLQADIYAWVHGFKNAKIIVKNLVKPELDTAVNYVPDISNVEVLLAAYIKENKDFIKKY